MKGATLLGNRGASNEKYFGKIMVKFFWLCSEGVKRTSKIKEKTPTFFFRQRPIQNCHTPKRNYFPITKRPRGNHYCDMQEGLKEGRPSPVTHFLRRNDDCPINGKRSRRRYSLYPPLPPKMTLTNQALS